MHRLLNDAAAGKANGGVRLGQDDIPLHGKAGGDAAGGGVRQDRDVKAPGLAVTAHGAAGFGHLHQREDPLLHSGAAGHGKAHHGEATVHGVLKQPGDLFAHAGAHAAHHEVGLHDEEGAGLLLHRAGAADHRLGLAADHADVLQLFGVSGEIDDVPALYVGKQLGKGVLIRKAVDALSGVHAEMVSALADAEVLADEDADGCALAAHGTLLGCLHLFHLVEDRGAAALLQLVFWLQELKKRNFRHGKSPPNGHLGIQDPIWFSKKFVS